MVDATITDRARDRERPLRCIVHYVDGTSGSYRYRVLPPGVRIQLPGPDTPLPTWADKKNWAESGERSYTAPTEWEGTAPTLPVHVGPWPVHEHSDAEQEEARLQKNRADMLLDATRLDVEDPLPEEYKRTLRRQEAKAERILENTEQRVDPRSVLPGSEDLGAILESGRFRVSGSVAFSPPQPFNPSPEPNHYNREHALIAQSDIDFAFPRDAN